MNNILEQITGLAKRRGFIYPGSEIYGGLTGTWDYGPLGVLLKRNIKESFWNSMMGKNDNIVGIDAAILMNPRVWEASGHVESFSDPLVECKKCHKRFRADQVEGNKCEECGGEFTGQKQFSLLVDANLGVVEGEKQKVYLRGEITQGAHVNFKNVLSSTRVQIPFGIIQIGKAFRNEITPGQLTFRSREFEQMELQYYIVPNDREAKKQLEFWKKERMSWYVGIGFNKKNLRFREHAPDERAHYARAAWDIEYHVPGGDWKELEGIHDRGDWDLKRHQEFSKEDLSYFDEETKERFVPRVIETSGGVDRAALFALMDAYREEEQDGEKRVVLGFHYSIAPYKMAVFPLLANKPKLVSLARRIYEDIRLSWMVSWDERGNIGKRYRTQDEAGTPYCVTVDFDSLDEGDVTVRNRDTMKQERVKIADLKSYFAKKLT